MEKRERRTYGVEIIMSEKRFSETERNCYYTSLVFDNQTQEELGTDEVVLLLNEQQYLLNHQNELLDEIFTIFQRYGIDTGYNKRILEIALENLTNGDDV